MCYKCHSQIICFVECKLNRIENLVLSDALHFVSIQQHGRSKLGEGFCNAVIGVVPQPDSSITL